MWRWGETMRNFEYNEDDEYKNEIDKFWQGDGDEDMDDEMYENKEIIQALEIQLAEKDLDLRILKMSIKTLESSFWWKFYNFRTRLKMIARTYLVLFKLLEKTRENEGNN